MSNTKNKKVAKMFHPEKHPPKNSLGLKRLLIQNGLCYKM